MLRRIGRFLELYLNRIDTIVILAMICYLIGMSLILYYSLR
jgi:hypothetical protein